MGQKMREHKLKTLPEYFEAMRNGTKTFDIRRDDRGFMVGDVLILQEWDPGRCSSPVASLMYTHRQMAFEVTYKFHGGRWGIDWRYCVLGVKRRKDLEKRL